MLSTSFVAGIISSVKETEIDVVFHDPKGLLNDAVIDYFWFINTVNYGQTPTVSVVLQHCCSSVLSALLRFHIFQGRFEYNFTVPGDYDVEVTAIAYFNAGISLSSQFNTNHVSMNLTEPNSTQYTRLKLERPSKGVKMAIFQKRIVSKRPISE